jgi:hypothetical protein
VLADIAKNDMAEWVSKAAVARVTDERLLADIAKNTKNGYDDNNRFVCKAAAGKAAVERVTDQSLIVDIAKNAKDWAVRVAAMERVTDQSVLADIAKNDRDYDVHHAAAIRVTDPRLCITHRCFKCNGRGVVQVETECGEGNYYSSDKTCETCMGSGKL